jgi:hypothetical protein
MSAAIPLVPANEPGELRAANDVMSEGAAVVHLVGVVGALVVELAALRAEVRALRPVAADANRLVSHREAARLLGVSRTRTLPLLLRQRGVNTVKVAGRPKIPMGDIERIGREGMGRAPAPVLPIATRRPAAPKARAPLARDLI